MLFLGIDVSKDKLDGAAVSEGTGAVLGRRSVPNTPDGVARLRRWAETIKGFEVMRMFKKGQFAPWIEAIGGTEASFVNRLFGIYA